MPKINCSAIPSIEIKRFCRTFCKAISDSTEDKDFRAKFDGQKSKEVDSLAPTKKGAYSTAGAGNSYTDTD